VFGWVRQHPILTVVGVVAFVAVMRDPDGAANVFQHVGSRIGFVANRLGDFFVALID
jgi:hypothetical protein